MMLPVVINGFAVLQDILAGSDQRQQMLSKTLPKFNRFTDLEEEKDLMIQSESVPNGSWKS